MNHSVGQPASQPVDYLTRETDNRVKHFEDDFLYQTTFGQFHADRRNYYDISGRLDGWMDEQTSSSVSESISAAVGESRHEYALTRSCLFLPAVFVDRLLYA